MSTQTTHQTEIVELFELTPTPESSPRERSMESLHVYMRQLSQCPMFTREEELEMFHRMHAGEEECRSALIASCLGLVIKIAMEYNRRWGVDLMDLIQEGNIGLMRAVDKFDPEKGVMLYTYAQFWIKAIIWRFLNNSVKNVRVVKSNNQRSQIFKLHKEAQRMQANGEATTDESLAANLDMSETEVTKLRGLMAVDEVSFDTPTSEDNTRTLLDSVPSEDAFVEEVVAREELADILLDQVEQLSQSLDERDKVLLQKRILTDSPMTLHEIGDHFGITREGVRQRENRLLKRLRTQLSKVDDFPTNWLLS